MNHLFKKSTETIENDNLSVEVFFEKDSFDIIEIHVHVPAIDSWVQLETDATKRAATKLVENHIKENKEEKSDDLGDSDYNHVGGYSRSFINQFLK